MIVTLEVLLVSDLGSAPRGTSCEHFQGTKLQKLYKTDNFLLEKSKFR